MSADAYLKVESEYEEHQKVINKLVLAIAGFQKDIQNGIVPQNWPTIPMSGRCRCCVRGVPNWTAPLNFESTRAPPPLVPLQGASHRW